MTERPRPTRDEAMVFARMAILANPMLLAAVADGGVRIHHAVPDHRNEQEGAVYVETLRDGRLGNNAALTEYYRRSGLTAFGDNELDEDEAAKIALGHTYEFTFGGPCGSATARAAATALLEREAERAEGVIRSALGEPARPSR